MKMQKRSARRPAWLRRQPTPEPPPGYREHQGKVAAMMGNFFLRYLNRLYHEFGGDMALVIVLGEVAHHNISQLDATQPTGHPTGRMRAVAAAEWEQFTPCNAFSVSAATGIPRETVRRKFAELVRRGWLQQSRRSEVRIVPAVAQHFEPEFNVWLLVELLALARRLEETLAQPVPSGTKAPPARKPPVAGGPGH